jgi:alpha-tubulin suppressor-like RCC1 family protein
MPILRREGFLVGAALSFAVMTGCGSVDAGDNPDGGTLPDDDAGDTTTTDGSPPAAVTWVQVATRTTHTCGIRSDGTLWCWGKNDAGQLGDGSEEASRLEPVQVVAAGESGEAPWADWEAVALGTSSTCGLRGDGTIWCWGSGGSGQRGDGSTAASRTTPSQVLKAEGTAGPAAWSDWVAIGLGGSTACGIRQDGTLWCWGASSFGQRGDAGDGGTARTTPIQVVASEESGEDPWGDWVALGGGGFAHTCGRRADSSLWCWGRGTLGQRGDGSTELIRTTPIEVLQTGEDAGGATWSDWTSSFAGGSDHTCGQRADGSLWCWGRGDVGQLGDGVDHDGGYPTAPVRVLAAGEDAGGASWRDWQSVSTTSGLSCGVRQAGTLWCWGSGGSGQRGDGTETDTRTTPVEVLAAGENPGGATWDDWVSVAAGGAYACGLRQDGSLWCWGSDTSGQLGNGDEADSKTPVQVIDP